MKQVGLAAGVTVLLAVSFGIGTLVGDGPDNSVVVRGVGIRRLGPLPYFSSTHHRGRDQGGVAAPHGTQAQGGEEGDEGGEETSEYLPNPAPAEESPPAPETGGPSTGPETKPEPPSEETEKTTSD